MVKRSLLAGACAALLATAAGAADLKVPAAAAYKAPPIIAPIDPWTGWYIGINAGYGFDLSGMTTGSSSPFFNGSQLATAPQGVTGGVQVGGNYRLTSLFVVGAEAEVNVGALKGTAAMPTLITATSENNWFGSLVARLGITPFQNLLVYGDGGLAFGNPQNTFTFNQLNTGCGAVPSSTCVFNGNGNSIGFAWGFGGETALDAHWKLGFDWRRYDFGKASVDASSAVGGVAGTIVFNPVNRYDVFRARLNYTF